MAHIFNLRYDHNETKIVIQTKDLLNKELLQDKLKKIFVSKLKTVKDLIEGKIPIYDKNYL